MSRVGVGVSRYSGECLGCCHAGLVVRQEIWPHADMQVPQSTLKWVSGSVGMIHSWDISGCELYYGLHLYLSEVEISISSKSRQEYEKA